MILLVTLVIQLTCVAGGWLYQGCHIENAFDRAFSYYRPNFIRDGPAVGTASDCQAYAESEGFDVISIREGGRCYLCNSAESNCHYDKYGTEDRCADLGNVFGGHVSTFDNATPASYCNSSYPYICWDSSQQYATDADRLRFLLSAYPAAERAHDGNDKCVETFKNAGLALRAPRQWPPPVEIPPELLATFTMNGSVALLSSYLAQEAMGATDYQDWNASTIELHKHLKGNYCFFEFPYQCQQLIDKYADSFVKGKVGAIFGSMSPWMEAALLQAGAAHLHTVEYMSILSRVDEISTLTPGQLVSRYLAGNWQYVDFVGSFSSFEHSGLGRYGDPLDPDGDLLAMSQAYCILKPGGIMFLSVPIAYDSIVFNMHRIYGRHRLPLLLRGFEVIDVVGSLRWDIDYTGLETCVLVLRKMPAVCDNDS